MRRTTLASTLVLILAGPALVIANGPGHGLGHALGKMGGQAKGASGINKATDRLGKSGLSRAAGLNRASGLAKGPHAKGPKVDGEIAADAAQHQRQLAIEQRNRDHRLAQAQKLRELGERNGSEELLANADRMEAAAHHHYQGAGGTPGAALA